MKAVLLVGGLGTRLRSVVTSTPKVLASVGERPFLELLVRQLAAQGVHRLVMCTGYLSEQIEDLFQDGRDFGATIEYSRETAPLGTGGALKLAQRYLQGESEFLVLNGDSFVEVNFGRLVDFHRLRGAAATLALVPVPNASRYGTVKVAADGRVQGFVEKAGHDAPGTINAGVYVFNRAVLDEMPEGASSLERDVFPRLLERGVYALEQSGIFIDIGTPDDYGRAQEMYERLGRAVLNSGDLAKSERA